MMIRNVGALALLLAAVAACAGAPAAPSGDAAADPARLYRARCSSCHRPYEPVSRTREQWRTALARMAPKAHLSRAERETLGGWLTAGASDATEGAR
jgi:hypothetical protein